MTYTTFKRGDPKESIISHDKNVIFHWELVAFIEQQSSLELLREVVDYWFNIRS